MEVTVIVIWELADGRLVLGAAHDGLLEDGRVRGHATDAVFIDVALDPARRDRAALALLLNQFCDQTSPTSLMAGAETCASVAVKKFMK